MHTITFDCEIITPIFLAGVDGSVPELRSPSIKGALRFWWRSMNADKSIDQLRKDEADIFGGTDEKVGRSKIIIRTSHPALKYDEHSIVPHRNYPFQAFDANDKQLFQVTLSLSSVQNNFDLQKLGSLFILTSLLGGFGKRSRRGFGCINIQNIIGCDVLKEEGFTNQMTLQDVLQHLNKFSGSYSLDNVAKPQKIVLNTPLSSKYPYIEEIKIGDKPYKSYDTLVMAVSNATHTYKGTVQDEPSLGYVCGGKRLASPVYVSSLKRSSTDYHIIITTLYMAIKDSSKPVDRKKQNNFKNAIL